METMSRKKVDVMLLQETWSPDPAGRWITPSGYLFLLHGAPRKADSGRRTCGVGFVLSPSAANAWEAAGAPFVNHPSSDGCARLASIRLSVREKSNRLVNFFLLSAYLPDQSYESTHPLETALDDMGSAIARRESTDVLVIGIDANVQIGKSALRTNGERNDIKNQIVGSHGLPNTCARSETLKQLLLSQQLCALNTFKKKRSYSTKYCTLHEKMYTCDYILVLQKDRVRVTNCGVGHSAPVRSHFPVRCDFRVAHRLRKLRTKPDPATAISYLKLRDPVIAKDFCSKIVATAPDKNTTYPEFTTAVVSATETTLSEPRPHDPPWFKLSLCRYT